MLDAKKDEIKTIVDGLVEYCCTTRPKEIIKELKIRLKLVDNLKNKYALYLKKEDDEYIFLSKECPEELEDFVLAHEIGHAILHDVEIVSYSPLDVPKSKIEREADYFACQLLNVEFEAIEGYTAKDYASMLQVNEDIIDYI